MLRVTKLSAWIPNSYFTSVHGKQCSESQSFIIHTAFQENKQTGEVYSISDCMYVTKDFRANLNT